MDLRQLPWAAEGGMRIGVDEGALAWAATVGIALAVLDEVDPRLHLQRASAIVLTTPSLQRLRGWRASGLRVPALLLGITPERRAELEPLVCVAPDTRSLEALDTLMQRVDGPSVAVPGGLVDLQRRLLVRGAVKTPLTQLQVDLLGYLAFRAQRPVPREELLEEVWRQSAKSRTRSVDMAVSRLRKLIEVDPVEPRILLTCQNSGYRYVPPEAVVQAGGLVGRSTLVRRLTAMLMPGRIVVLHGPPGVGKTSIARAVTRGGSFVSIEGCATLDEAAWTLASGLGVAVSQTLDVDAVLLAVLSHADLGVLAVDGADGVPGLVDALERLPRSVPIVLTQGRRPTNPGVDGVIVPTLDEVDAITLLREVGHLTESEDLLRQVVQAVGTLPLALVVAAPRVAALGGQGTAQTLLSVGSDSLLTRTVRAAVDVLPAHARRALDVLACLQAPVTLEDLSQILGTSSHEAWVELHQAGILQAVDGRGTLLPAIREVVRQTLSTPVRAAVGHFLVTTVREQLARLEGPAARAAIERLGELEVDGWRFIDRRCGSEEAAVVLEGLEALDAWRGAPKRLRLSRIDVQLSQATGPARARCLLLRAAVLGASDWRRVSRDVEEALSLGPDALLTAHLCVRGAAAAGWQSLRDEEMALLDRGLQGDVPVPWRHRLRCRRLLCSGRAGELPLSEAGMLVLGVFEAALAEDHVAAACFVAGDLIVLLQVAGTPPQRLFDIVSRAVQASERHGDPLLRAHLRLGLAPILAALGRPEGALTQFASAEALFAAVDPVRVLQVASVRGRWRCERGDHEDARRDLLRVLAWASSEDVPSALADAALYLVSVEGDAGDPTAMLRYAVMAERASPPGHLHAHAVLGQVYAHVVCGDVESALAARTRLDAERLSPVGVVELLTCEAVLTRKRGADPAAVDQALLKALGEAGGASWEVARAITRAGLAGDPQDLEGELGGVGNRLLARIWASLPNIQEKATSAS